MKKGKILIIFMIMMMMILSYGDVKAASSSVSYELDNDEANNPSGTNGWTGLWHYLTGTRHFRGDARIQEITTGEVYFWGYTGNGGPSLSNPEIYVYLNDAKFTCSKASYQFYAKVNGEQIQYFERKINQNIAPTGWGYIGTAHTYGSKRVSHMVVTSFVKESGYMGADGVRFTQLLE